MKSIDHKEFIDEIIATSIDIDPMAMYYVLEKMKAQSNSSADLMEKDAMLAASVDEIIAGIDQVLQNIAKRNEKPNNIFSNDLDRWIESQPELKYASEHMMEWAIPDTQHDFVWFEKPFTGLDELLPQQTSLNTKAAQPVDNSLTNDFVWFESSMDRWLASQPDLKHTLDQLPDTTSADDLNFNKKQQTHQNKVA